MTQTGKKNTCLMGEFSGFFFFFCFPSLSLVHSSGLVSSSLPHESSCSLSFFLVVCVFQFFSKELWICRWWAAPVPEAGSPCGRAGTRGRPTAAERISVFKAFENKLTAVPRVQGGGWQRGSWCRLRLESRPQGLPCQVRREGCEESKPEHFSLLTSSLVRVSWAPCPSQASSLGAS